MQTTERTPTAEQGSPPPPSGVRQDLRSMRTTLLAIGAFVLAVLLAVGIAWAWPSSDNTVSVRATDYRIAMATTLRPGRHAISFHNAGVQPHELLMFRTSLPANRLPVDASGNVIEDSPLMHQVLDSGNGLPAGHTQSLTVRLEPGHYAVICNLPGHYRFGMRLDLTVRS
jgi:hypothetical protein